MNISFFLVIQENKCLSKNKITKTNVKKISTIIVDILFLLYNVIGEFLCGLQ